MSRSLISVGSSLSKGSICCCGADDTTVEALPPRDDALQRETSA